MRRSVSTVRLTGLSRSGTFPSGNPRFYFRAAGQKAVPMPDAAKDSSTFIKAWTAARDGAPLPGPKRSARTGTIGAAVLGYLASDHLLALSSSTRQHRRKTLDDIAARYGSGRLADLQAQHIRRDLARLDAHPANNRLKCWRALCRWSVDAGLVDHDAARDVRKRPAPQSDGHRPWTQSDVDAFRARWPIGSMQRLALELLAHTGAARVDVVRLGPGNVDPQGWLSYRRRKSGSLSLVPFTCPAPAWFPASPFLPACIGAAPRHLTWLSTASGASRSDKAFGSWFSAATRAASIEPGKTAHGLRKYLAVTMAERGASSGQRMAILGHESESESRHYSKAADLRQIISGTNVSNFSDQVGNRAKK